MVVCRTSKYPKQRVFLSVSDDTIRRWIGNGTLTPNRDDSGRLAVSGLELAHLARDEALLPEGSTRVLL